MKGAKLIRVLIVLSLLCFGFHNSLSAQSKEWTLRECVEFALDNNIDIKQREISVEQSDIDLNSSKSSRLPDLAMTASQSFDFGRGSFQSSPGTYEYYSKQSTGTSVSLSTSVPIFSGMRISHQIKSDQLNLKAAVENLNKARENLELNVTSLYLQTLFKKEILTVYIDNHNLTLLQAARTETLFESGKIAEAQLYEVRAQLAKDELNMVVSHNDMELSLLNLAQALNIEDRDFDILSPSTDIDIFGEGYSSMLSPEEIYQTALAIKPHVKEMEYRLMGSERSLKLAKADFWPTFSFGASYNNAYSYVFNDEYINDNFSSQVKDNQRQSIGFNLRIPIFNRLQTRNQVSKARLNIRNSELQLDFIKQEMYKEIRQAHQSATAAQAKYLSTQSALEAAQKAYEYDLERYNVGKLTAYEFSETQTKLLTSRSEQVQAKYDYIFRSKILDFYRGVEIDIRY